MSPLKIAVIGGGNITGAHLPNLAHRSEVELIGLADVNPAAIETAHRYGIARFTHQYRELLPDADAVIIGVPTHLHVEVAVTALRAGKAVFCEKPLARTLEEADAIAHAAQESGAPVQVGFVRRFDPEWLAWRDAVRSHMIGRPVIWCDVASGAGPSASWFMRDEQGGGPFLDGCIHNFDFALWIFGQPQWAFCHGRTFREDATAIDTGTATVRFQSGDELLLAWSWGLPVGCTGGRIFEILGPKGTLTWPRVEDAGEPHFAINRGEGQPVENVSYPADALSQGFAQ